MGYPIEWYAIIYRIRDADVLILRVAIVFKKSNSIRSYREAVAVPNYGRILFAFCSPLSYNPGITSLGIQESVAYEVLAHRHLHLGRSDDNA